jgi:hypothetical protein
VHLSTQPKEQFMSDRFQRPRAGILMAAMAAATRIRGIKSAAIVHGASVVIRAARIAGGSHASRYGDHSHRDIVMLGTLGNRIGIYRFRYNWSDQVYVGVMAQEVEQIVEPDSRQRQHQSAGLPA